MGADVLGYLIHTAGGRFSVTISHLDRPGLTGGDLFGGSVQEKARAADGFVAYAGRYTFHGHYVVHHVQLSLLPNWVGTAQQRPAELSKDQLILSATPLLLGGRQQVPGLVWARVRHSPEADLPRCPNQRAISCTDAHVHNVTPV